MAKITEEIGRGDWGKCLASSICGRLLPIFRNKRHPPLKYTQKKKKKGTRDDVLMADTIRVLRRSITIEKHSTTEIELK